MSEHQPRIPFRAVSAESLALGTEIGFDVPMIEHSSKPGDFEYWWKLLKFVFELSDPRSFPPLPCEGLVAATSLAGSIRFVELAQDMAISSILNTPQEVTVHVDQAEQIDETFSANEITRGFAVTFRQFYSGEEHASFQSVHRLLGLMNESAGDVSVQTRRATLKGWRVAEGRLRAYPLHVLAGKKLADQGLIHPSLVIDSSQWSPSELISIYNYGDLVHWGDRRDELAALGAHPVTRQGSVMFEV